MNGIKTVGRMEQAHPSDGSGKGRSHHRRRNELRVIGGWRWLEQRLDLRGMMRRERHKREEESAQLSFLSALGIAA